MKDLIRSLLAVPSVSGREEPAAALLAASLTGVCTCRRDRLGNLLALREGTDAYEKTLLITAHMDVPGFFITCIEEDGRLRFALSVPDMTLQNYLGARLSDGNCTGTLCCADSVRSEDCKPADCWIDIGAASRAEAAAKVTSGDAFAPVAAFSEKDRLLTGRSVAARCVLAAAVEAARRVLPSVRVVFAFTTRGIAGASGTKTAATAVRPDAAIVLRESEGPFGAPLILTRDGLALSDCTLFTAACEVAKEANIPYLPTGTDKSTKEAYALSLSATGVPTLSLALPVKAPGTAEETVSEADLEALAGLTAQLAQKIL